MNERTKIIVVPGHTPGSMAPLVDDKYLFTGDHLSWDRDRKHLEAFDDYCFYSWQEQVRSMERLALETFEWVLPGHGQQVRLPADEMKHAIQRLIAKMAWL